MMMMIDDMSCLEVFCDVPGGILTARRPRDSDDVSWMTSSASNIRRTCSYYEPTSSSTQLYLQQQLDVDEQDDVTNDTQSARSVELESADDVFNDVMKTLSQLEALQLAADVEEEPSTKDISSLSDTTNTTTVLAPAAVAAAAALAATRPVPVVPRRPRPDSVSAITPPDGGSGGKVEKPRPRPTPPVSRVKPMVRHSIMGGAAAADQRDIQLKTFADNNANNATAHASSRPVPVPARRRPAINTVDDIPSDLATLSVADVAKCVTLLGLGQQQADLMMKHNVDGEQLIQLTDSQLTDEFHFTPLDAKKLVRFSRGWRPT